MSWSSLVISALAPKGDPEIMQMIGDFAASTSAVKSAEEFIARSDP